MNIFAKLAMVESKMMEGGMRSRRLFCAASVPDLITKQAFADTDAGGVKNTITPPSRAT